MGRIWRSVGVVNDENMMQPHVLQQRMDPVGSESYHPTDDHRLVPVTDLDGIE